MIIATRGGEVRRETLRDELRRRLSRPQRSTFEVGESELILEGVPKYFLLREEALLNVLARAAVRHRRISMGIQTFDAGWLRRIALHEDAVVVRFRRSRKRYERQGLLVQPEALREAEHAIGGRTADAASNSRSLE